MVADDGPGVPGKCQDGRLLRCFCNPLAGRRGRKRKRRQGRRKGKRKGMIACTISPLATGKKKRGRPLARSSLLNREEEKGTTACAIVPGEVGPVWEVAVFDVGGKVPPLSLLAVKVQSTSCRNLSARKRSNVAGCGEEAERCPRGSQSTQKNLSKFYVDVLRFLADRYNPTKRSQISRNNYLNGYFENCCG